jgi:hypothetical protein
MDNLTITSVIDMDLESPSSQGLCDHDERFPVQTLPPIHNQPPISISFTQTLSNKPDKISDETNNNNTQLISESDLLVDKANVEQTESTSNESNNIEDDTNRSRDEFVKLLTKEAYVSKSPSPSETVPDRRRSHDNEESSMSSTRTVTLISNNHEDKLIIEATNINPEKPEEEEEPTVKRIKVDLISPSNDGLFSFILSTIHLFPCSFLEINSVSTNTNARNYRQDFDERRQQEELNNKSTHSRKPSTKKSSSSFNNRYPRQRRNEYERNRSSERSYQYPTRNINNSISPDSPSTRHQRFNYNHQSVAEHPRFANINTIPSPGKNFNYNSFSTSNYSQSTTDYHDASSIPNANRK